MRPVAFLTRAFAGCRAKCYAMCEQIFGKDCVDVYRISKAWSDVEFVGVDADHLYVENPSEVMDEVLKHEYIHAFCDNTMPLKSLVKSGEPFICHQHDICSMRVDVDWFEPHLYAAKQAVKVMTSLKHAEYMTARWKLDPGEITIVQSLPLMSMQPEIPKPEYKLKNSIVYFGGLQTTPDAEMGYRFYLPYWTVLAEAGIQVHVYTTGRCARKAFDKYIHPLIFLHNRIPHYQLYQELSKYEVGFAGYNDLCGVPKTSRDYCVTCVPNKTFDYMFAGIPTLAYNMGESRPWINQWGKCVRQLDEIVPAFRELQGVPYAWEEFRNKYCMETQRGLLAGLYERVRRNV